MKLNDRLMQCAKLLRGRKMADVGTDHAYLPVYLAVNGLIPFAVACDINEGPLNAARRNVGKYGVGDVVSLRLSDGLKNIRADEADDIVIAGMGGELIARIIADAPWLASPDKLLVLQPMTRAAHLRVFLAENGFYIDREHAVSAAGHIYTVMSALYAPDKLPHSALYPYIGALGNTDALDCEYILKCADTLLKRAHGLEHSADAKDAAEILEIAAELKNYVNR